MVKVIDVRAALERIAVSEKTGEVRAGLKQLRKSLNATTTAEAKAEAQDILNAHVLARTSFEVGADIVAKGRKRKANEQTIRHRLMTYAASRLNVRERVPATFKAVVAKDGTGSLALELRDTRALIDYAFWIVAPEIEQNTWWRYRTQKCDVCGRTFRHRPPWQGRPRTATCSDDCREKQDRHDRPRKCIVCGRSIKSQPRYMKICSDTKCEKEKARRDMAALNRKGTKR